jgi:hypothetical protein
MTNISQVGWVKPNAKPTQNEQDDETMTKMLSRIWVLFTLQLQGAADKAAIQRVKDPS